MSAQKSEHNSQLVYIRIAKWYNAILIASLIVLSTLNTLRLQTVGFSITRLDHIFIMMALFIALIGILTEKKWSRWLTISVYVCALIVEFNALNRSLLFPFYSKFLIYKSLLYPKSLIEAITHIVFPSIVELTMFLILGGVLLLRQPRQTI